MNAAERCKAEGWGVGTVLQWNGSRIRITAIGDVKVLYRRLPNGDEDWSIILDGWTRRDPLAPVDFATASKTPGVYRGRGYDEPYHASDGETLWFICPVNGCRVSSSERYNTFTPCPDLEPVEEKRWVIRKKGGAE